MVHDLINGHFNHIFATVELNHRILFKYTLFSEKNDMTVTSLFGFFEFLSHRYIEPVIHNDIILMCGSCHLDGSLNVEIFVEFGIFWLLCF